MIGRLDATCIFALLLALLLGGCDREPQTAPAAGGQPAGALPATTRPEEAPAADGDLVDESLETLLDPDAEGRAEAAMTIADELRRLRAGNADRYVQALDRALPQMSWVLTEEQEDPVVKLAIVEAYRRFDTDHTVKFAHSYFYRFPEHVEAWHAAGDWLLEKIGPGEIEAILRQMRNRDDYDLLLVLEFAKRHPDEPLLAALAEELEAPMKSRREREAAAPQ